MKPWQNSLAKPKPVSNQSYAWNIDSAVTTISFRANEVVYSSEYEKRKFSVSPCSKPILDSLKQQLQTFLEKETDAVALPPGYSPILLEIKGLGSLKIPRGNRLGLFLIDFKTQIYQTQMRIKDKCNNF